MKHVPVRSVFAAGALLGAAFGFAADALAQDSRPQDERPQAQLGPRPFYLVNDMNDGELKDALKACETGPFYRTTFSIGHRGAPMQFPEHTRQSYQAAAVMGAGVIECDVAFTKDRELVCRHSQCDLATTTDILAHDDLAAKCTTPFSPASGDKKAEVKCCTSDLTLAEFKSLKGKMDAGNPDATTVEEFMDATPSWRTDLYATNGELMSHKESIALFKDLGVKFTPELKAPSVEMPFEGDYTQDDYAQQLIDEYKEAGVDASDVYPQSFQLRDILYWIKNDPEFGKQGVFLDDRDETLEGFDANNPETFKPSMQELAEDGVKIIAPPSHMLLTLNEAGEIVPSAYAKEAKKAGLKIITWSLERSGTLTDGGGYYYQSVKDAISHPGDEYEVIDVLAKDVGVIGMFSDWPATVTYYANCMGLE
ncbi:glycerophosphodiester phosphodiesterase family protein [Afifella marina]|uniref:glycerophosphodiester phosphodiesterase n=2 Tax=Hyphomicrobiales TaxID=356 RepID=A0A1G5MU69_AFIMA|nr:glycerophosphodiester phosphodiesterase family protein [Afifella marina]MBK1621980.1 glycerophosphodiester phosphodiesterase [Afifella marina DSM 2698]MBK1627773.1 glycerophosphodiester phosphodiesterase [Afifella marina]MBK5916740.1 glycerophosphodiester phosphodiesterase [Afifella marina]RAI19933.1 glycerophosphodiester phosphodiesterase [Afifella marina DSM 2698]SCZ28626.1 glycerophosphoryl diester phosphodiesterase [Afifella marina DSM 2698]